MTLRPIDWTAVQILPGFWRERQAVIRDRTLPYQWQALNDEVPDAPPSHAFANFRIAAGAASGEHRGFVFQDSDVYKWLEAVGYVLAHDPDRALETQADTVIGWIAKAQQADGYVNTYYQLVKPEERWTNLRDDHELYCAGHLFEAAVAYFQGTGKDVLLKVACRFADHLCEQFGPNPGQLPGYPGHPEVELALVRLYRTVGDRRYLKLAEFFIDSRGNAPNFFVEEAARRKDARPANLAYYQSHTPIRRQETAEGHAVRAMYLFAGAADVALERQDAELESDLLRLWDNVTQHRMYVTGGVGSEARGEAFTVDDDLPPDRAYAETCAAIGLIFWAHRMNRLTGESRFADVIERALYNGVLSGVSSDGSRYFYVNPLEVWPAAVRSRHDLQAIKIERQRWLDCACCPPNLARLVASLGGYLYATDREGLVINLYTSSEVRARVAGGEVRLRQETQYPWSGTVHVHVESGPAADWALRLRIPEWTSATAVEVNGEAYQDTRHDRGYLVIRRTWRSGDRVRLDLAMDVRPVYPHPNVRALSGRMAFTRGPIVYAFEGTDNQAPLSALAAAPESWEVTWTGDVGGGAMCLRGRGVRWSPTAPQLYAYDPPEAEPVVLHAVPYYAWGNRGATEMRVWMPRAPIAP